MSEFQKMLQKKKAERDLKVQDMDVGEFYIFIF